MAPDGGDSLAVLLPVPNLASGDDWDAIGDAWRDRVVRYLEDVAGLEGLEASIEVEHRRTPLDFLRRFDADEGNAFGTEPLLTRSAWFRQPNRDRTVRWPLPRRRRRASGRRRAGGAARRRGDGRAGRTGRRAGIVRG